jgi:hypothetical protein
MNQTIYSEFQKYKISRNSDKATLSGTKELNMKRHYTSGTQNYHQIQKEDHKLMAKHNASGNFHRILYIEENLVLGYDLESFESHFN